jgi:hypothetical protein
MGVNVEIELVVGIESEGREFDLGSALRSRRNKAGTFRHFEI